jgi:predicted transcriptional regulator of viral defense system
MACTKQKSSLAWDLVRRQHGVIARFQLLALGFTRAEIEHRLAVGRLHCLLRGVYAVGRRELSEHGLWMAAVLSCGPGAVLSHEAAGALWRIREARRIEVTVPGYRRRPGVTVHRRTLRPEDMTTRDGVPVTTPAATLVDLATRLGDSALERAVNQADQLDLIDPEKLRADLDHVGRRRRGAARLRRLLDRYTFSFTRSELEQALIPIALAVGLPMPLTCVIVNGYEVDFYWPDLGLVVEADSLRYHRTAAKQTRDLERDQAHARAGLTCIRFSHAQIKYDPEYVRNTLAAVVSRLTASHAAA